MPAKRSLKSKNRGEILKDAPLHYAPQNELGVVFLFAEYAKKHRLRIDEIKSGFPDCIAYQKTQNGETKIRIEFEYQSRNFKTHGHSAKSCDWLVCWEDNWAAAPKGLQIVELRTEYGLGFNVWIVPSDCGYDEELHRSVNVEWSAPSKGHKGDLILFYLTKPEMSITYIYELQERVYRKPVVHKDGSDYMARMKKVCKLKSPIFLEDFRKDRILCKSSFARSQRGRPSIKQHWSYLYEMIIKRNPTLKKVLSPYDRG